MIEKTPRTPARSESLRAALPKLNAAAKTEKIPAHDTAPCEAAGEQRHTPADCPVVQEALERNRATQEARAAVEAGRRHAHTLVDVKNVFLHAEIARVAEALRANPDEYRAYRLGLLSRYTEILIGRL